MKIVAPVLSFESIWDWLTQSRLRTGCGYVTATKNNHVRGLKEG
jgi:hypothetical protein